MCTGLSGATPEQRLFGANGYLRRIYCALCARRGQARLCWHTGQQTVHVRCAPDTQVGPQVRSSNGQNPTAVMTWQGAPDCPVCTGLSGAPSNRQPPPTVKFGGWGYKYPNHPHIQSIQVFQLPTNIQELAFIAKHTKKRSNPLPTPHKALVFRESDL